MKKDKNFNKSLIKRIKTKIDMLDLEKYDGYVSSDVGAEIFKRDVYEILDSFIKEGANE